MNVVLISNPEPEVSFDTFWLAYPRHVAKAAARKAWAKLSTEQQTAAIIGIVAWRPIMLAKDPEYICHGSTWLSGERWEDELPRTAMSMSHVPFKDIPLPPKGVLPDEVLKTIRRITGRQ